MEDTLPIGTLLANQYRLTEIVGEGGMGVVYRARQETVGRDVAVKILRGRHAKDDVVVRRFENEARIISQLRHPNTLRLYDTQRLDSGGLFIVTEFLEGQSLEQLLRVGPMPIDRVVSVADQICASLSEAHSMGVVHRDLKPGNIFLDRVGAEDYVKVLDFGIAKLQAGGIIKTQANVIMGTPAYMSPEQVKGENADARSDIYAVGVLIYQMLTGAPPFIADNPVTLLMKQVNDAPPPFARQLGIPLELEALVFEMLSKHADFRPQKITEARERLRAIARKMGASLHAPTTGPMTPPAMTAQDPLRSPLSAETMPLKKPASRPTSKPGAKPGYPARERSDEMPTQPNMAPLTPSQQALPRQPVIGDTSQIPVTIPIDLEPELGSQPPKLEMFLDEGPISRPETGTHAQKSNRVVIYGAIGALIVIAGAVLFFSRPPSEDAPVTTPLAPVAAPDPKINAPVEEEKKPVAVEEPKQAKPVEEVKAVEDPKVVAPVVEEEKAPAKKKGSGKKKHKGSGEDEALERAASKILTEPPSGETEVKEPEVPTRPDEATNEPEPEPEPEKQAAKTSSTS